MNPILSDLHIRIAAIDAEADLVARQRRQLAAKGEPGARFALVEAIRQFVNPRRYALSVLAAREQAQPATRPALRVTPPLGGTVTVLTGRVEDAGLRSAA